MRVVPLRCAEQHGAGRNGSILAAIGALRRGVWQFGYNGDETRPLLQLYT
jgi:hypothetical protein